MAFLASAGLAPGADDVSAWGIASSSSGAKDMPEWMPRMKEAGAGMVRLFPEWNGVEPRRGEWHWERADAVTRAAAASGVQVNGILMGSVPWSGEKPHTFPMNDLAAWSEYVNKTMEHCGSSIRYWEVWNEGNGGFNSGKHTTVDYAKLAAATYTAAKKADASAQIGLTTASFDPAYLGHAIAAQKTNGSAAQFDFLCVHPYELADGIGEPDGEVPFLWMSQMMRATLKQTAPEKIGADLWITEIGRNVARRKDQAVAERAAASSLLKLYTMAFAQGIRCVQWFEGRDPMGEEPGFGLLKRDGSPRLTFQAFQRLAAELGQTPRPLGWLALGDGGRTYGFVFAGQSEPVLVLWKNAGASAQKLTLGKDVEVTAPLDSSTHTIAATQSLDVGDEPIFVHMLPANLLAQAKANAAQPFPWGGNYAAAKTVSAQLGADAAAAGVFQSGPHSQPHVTFPDGTTGLLLRANEGARFYVHPSFASLQTSEYYVRVTVRRVTPGNVGMNLHYEVADSQGLSPYRNVGTWFGLNDSTGWQTFTWHVQDACLAKMWGYDLAFVPEQSQPFAIGKVEVSTEMFTGK